MLSFQTRCSAWVVPVGDTFRGAFGRALSGRVPCDRGEIDQFWSHSWRANTFLKALGLRASTSRVGRDQKWVEVEAGGSVMGSKVMVLLLYYNQDLIHDSPPCQAERADKWKTCQAPAAFFSILSGGVGMAGSLDGASAAAEVRSLIKALRALHILPYFVKLEPGTLSWLSPTGM